MPETLGKLLAPFIKERTIYDYRVDSPLSLDDLARIYVRIYFIPGAFEVFEIDFSKTPIKVVHRKESAASALAVAPHHRGGEIA